MGTDARTRRRKGANLSEGKMIDTGLPRLRIALPPASQPDRTLPVRAFSRSGSTTAV